MRLVSLLLLPCVFAACGDDERDGPTRVGECRLGGVIDARNWTPEEPLDYWDLICGGEACPFNPGLSYAYRPCSDTQQLIELEFFTGSDGGDHSSIVFEVVDGQVQGTAYAYYRLHRPNRGDVFDAESGSIEIARIATDPREPDWLCVAGRVDIRFHETLQMTGTFELDDCRRIDDLDSAAP